MSGMHCLLKKNKKYGVYVKHTVVVTRTEGVVGGIMEAEAVGYLIHGATVMAVGYLIHGAMVMVAGNLIHGATVMVAVTDFKAEVERVEMFQPLCLMIIANTRRYQLTIMYQLMTMHSPQSALKGSE
jgi:hypothetical protein